MAKAYLIICDRPPYGSISFRESLDMATAAAAFDLPVEVLLRDDGIFAALAAQDSSDLEQKNTGKALGALMIYGVSGIYVDQASLLDRQLSADRLVPEVEVIDDVAVSRLLAQDKVVVQL